MSSDSEEENMVDVAIAIAAVKEISLKPSLDTGQGTGDCLLEASISQFHMRPNLGHLLNFKNQDCRKYTVHQEECQSLIVIID